MRKPFEQKPDRNEIRTRIMGLGERAGRKSYYPQLQARIQELEEKSGALSRMLAELEAARRRAEESEKRFRELAELLPQTVYEIDRQGRLIFINRQAFKMFGYQPDEVPIGLNALELFVPEDRARVSVNIQKRLQGQELTGQQYMALRKDGSTFPCIAYAVAVHDESGAIGLRGIVVDIGEQVRLRQQKEQIEAQYHQSQKMEAVGRLAGGVAHDLNNMLSPILGYAELLLNDFSTGDARIKSVQAIQRAGLKARDLVRQLLAFSRKQALEVQVADLNQVILSFQQLLRRMIREDIEIQLALTPRIPPVQADVSQIEQVIMNLAVNAQDAMPEGGKLSIETSAVELTDLAAAGQHDVPPGVYVRLVLRDSGHGMDDAIRTQIFDPFFTTKEKDKGTGLGLATVYGVVKQHGGSIHVDSEPGKGAAFNIYLPARTTAAADIAEQPATSDSDDPRGSEVVLLAEDDDEVRTLAVNILMRQGYRVQAVSNAAECLRLIDTHGLNPDLLVTDVIMPDMNGKALFQQVAQRCAGIKVLYMSGYPADVIGQHGVLEPGIAYIQKPFSVNGLATKVREVLDR
jgi:PAS domain S-box-containing protein